MNFTLTQPTLEARALVTIAIELCGRCNMRDWKRRMSLSHWKELFEMAEIIGNVTVLPLPPLLKEKLVPIVEQIILQMKSWLIFHTREHLIFGNDLTELPACIVWTPQGTIDSKRTAAILVKDETIDVENRLKLACIYCLEDDILDLRGKLNRDLKWLVHRSSNNNAFLTCFWSAYSKEQLELYFTRGKNITCYESLFQYSAVTNGNEAATRYFYFKLRPENADNLKMQTAKEVVNMLNSGVEDFPENRYNDILYFLLTKMNVEQQAEICASCTFIVLKSLLIWPRQNLFLEMAKNNLNDLSIYHFCLLLQYIIKKMTNKSSYLREVFFKFWQQSPETYKQYLRNGPCMNMFIALYKKDDEKNASLLVKDLSISARKSVIFSRAGQDICKFLVYYENWDSVKYLIQCISSPEEMTEFKDQIRKNITLLHAGTKVPDEHQWNTFLQMVEDLDIIHEK